MDTTERIEAALRVLIGEPLVGEARAANMAMFRFGSTHERTNRKGQPATVAEFALHIQCAWRLVGPQGIEFAYHDMYYPAGDPYKEPPEFMWDKQSANRHDERRTTFFQRVKEQPLFVESLVADNLGGFT